MCGIAGVIAGPTFRAPLGEVICTMTDTLGHRGPDGSGAWVDDVNGVALGHRRLSIIDLSPLGKQPMHSASGRFVVTFNGEIYNFAELRAELQGLGRSFTSRSDTEVMLTAFEEWGVGRALQRFIGMFAFVAWDREQRILSLCRDRLGKKPLYYGNAGDSLVFASELKAIRHFPGFNSSIDREALALYFRHNYVPAPYSIYRDIRKLDAGALLQVSVRGGRWIAAQPSRYWTPSMAYEGAAAAPFTGSMLDAQRELEAILGDAVRLRMISDVPLGAFLSGGIDSSLIAALMQRQSSVPIRTFTIGFHASEYDEAQYARAVASHLGTRHTEVYLQPQDALDVIPTLATVYDEPFADSSQIPTMLVCRVARENVTVAVSGDGGDESFGGYHRYFWLRRLWQLHERLPRALRSWMSGRLYSLSADSLNSLYERVSAVIPAHMRMQSFGTRLHRIADLLEGEDPMALYRKLVSLWDEPEKVVLGASEPHTAVTRYASTATDSLTRQVMKLDLETYLPDDILVKVDRASMAVSLEVRAPLIDHRVVEFAASLPLQYLISGSRGKLLLRQILYQYVPRQLLERPKTGFGVPIDLWLKGPLKEWASDLLNEQALRQDGFLRPEPILERWREHLQGSRQWHYSIWVVLMFQAWLREQERRPSLAVHPTMLEAAHGASA